MTRNFAISICLYQIETIIITFIYIALQFTSTMMENDEDIHKTPPISLSLESFQSIFHSLNGKIESLSMDITFQSKQIAEKFQQVKTELFQESHQLISDEEQESQQLSQRSEVSVKPKLSDYTSLMNLNVGDGTANNCYMMPIKHQPIVIYAVKPSNLSLDYYQKIDINFPQSIILKQHYSNQIQSIAKNYQTDIDIIPLRIKFMSNLPEAIQDAIDQVEQLRNKIQIHNVQQNAQEIFCSRKYLNKLHPVQMCQIQGRYYIWYDNTKISDQEVKYLKKEVFDNRVHRFYQFSSKRIWNSTTNNDQTMSALGPFGKKPNKQPQINFPNSRQANKMSFMEKMVLNLKKSLFLKFFDEKLKKIYKDQSELQVSSDEQALIIHCGTHQQVQMLQAQLNDQYKKYLYFCLEYNANEYLQSAPQLQKHNNQISSSSKNLETLQPPYYKLQDILTAFDANQNICYVSSGGNIWIAVKDEYLKEQVNLKKFIQNFQFIEFCCSIVYMHLKSQIPSDEKYISSYCKLYPWLVQVRLKNPTRKNFEQFFRKYIIEGKKDVSDLQSNLVNSVFAVQKVSQSFESSQNQINVSNTIQDSTVLQPSMIDTSIYHQNKNAINNNILNDGFLNTSKQVQNLQLNSYSILLVQDNQVFKNQYSEQAKTVEIASSKTNKSFDAKIKQSTNGIAFKSYALTIPDSLRPPTMEGQIVTLFVKQKQLKGKDLEKQAIKVRLIQGGKQIKQNGYLVNAAKNLINQTDKGALQLNPNTYQIFKYLKCISN